ncbi:MAG TPA: DNA-binding protein [Streptosporangiaceae bacterium]|nr:DNA-binding protein [Streptosporangiaceae bacterium]
MTAVAPAARLLSLPRAAELLDVPPRRLRDNWKAWGIPAYRVGRELRFREDELWGWLRARKAA